MEVAGLALAIGGLAGQAVSGLTILKAFFAAYKVASTKVNTLNFELESLVSTLQEVERLLRQSRHNAPFPPRLQTPASQGMLPPSSASWSSPGAGGSSGTCDMRASSGDLSGTTESSLRCLSGA
ncbi:hypothetical protein ISF_06747 [Cordyceps fumosorosea ARSEF 2679]|uniref:Fungal N-terminal domain-containing protein n=1 Tax=Cordyceps fumosorosea (strain ARSEF 2679) TaxID=1081104 RepID=A0A167R2D8_CORFA|nr:hypothetical protein ISF_06747 [Cordyceps fumosorosea ARSEF 2679]OAA58208.1 hypothetical protein ISF_06747 [Cordyceps fumosorosea ARSEF 2679]